MPVMGSQQAERELLGYIAILAALAKDQGSVHVDKMEMQKAFEAGNALRFEDTGEHIIITLERE